jgi:hypothetical protein
VLGLAAATGGDEVFRQLVLARITATYSMNPASSLATHPWPLAARLALKSARYSGFAWRSRQRS